jgi:hypothetical protein
MRKLFLILTLGIAVSGCNRYHKGFIVNSTAEAVKITIKPNLLSLYDSIDAEEINKLKAKNISMDKSEFACWINPFDTFSIKNGSRNIFYTPLLLLEQLRIEKAGHDPIVLNSQAEIRKYLKDRGKGVSGVYYTLDVGKLSKTKE